MELNLKDRIALVTGGGAGIGEAIAQALAAEGCKLWILDRDAGAAESTAKAIGQQDGQARWSILDVSDAASVYSTFERISRDDRIDILINAAGLLSTGAVADLPVTEWHRVSEVNIAGMLYCIKAAMPVMSEQHYGRIINIASISAARGGGSVGNTLYGTTKAGVVAMTMGLARELGPQGITVNAISPAVADTAMTRKSLTADARARILARIPLGRMASLSDIANLAVFLASDCASFITGTAIPVDGGILTT
jgi:3-oxoacyl-[acyl-carrier protein] reductase